MQKVSIRFRYKISGQLGERKVVLVFMAQSNEMKITSIYFPNIL